MDRRCGCGTLAQDRPERIANAPQTLTTCIYMVTGQCLYLSGSRPALNSSDAGEEGDKARVQVSIVLDVLGIIKVSTCSSEAVEGLPEVVVGVLISPAFALEHLYGLVVLSNDVN